MSQTTTIPVGEDYDVLVGHGVSARVAEVLPQGVARVLVVLGEPLSGADALTYGAIALAIVLLCLDGLPKPQRRDVARARKRGGRVTGRRLRPMRRPTPRRDDATAAAR